jgi:hypothetical protein
MRRPKYFDGRPIHAGDRVIHAGQHAIVLAVLQANDFASERDRAEWQFLKEGFVIAETETGETYHYQEADEDIEYQSSEA